jgi:hypothetical protein
MLISFVVDRVTGVRSLFQFPDPVNETSARVVAAGVVMMGVLFLATGSGWVLWPLVYGFAARVATGPTLSPLGRLATQVVTPNLAGPHRLVPGRPKRFAQGVGLTFSAGAGVAWLLGLHALTYGLIAGLVMAATLESAFAVCLGCMVFNRIWGCADCADISNRLGTVRPEPISATR